MADRAARFSPFAGHKWIRGYGKRSGSCNQEERSYNRCDKGLLNEKLNMIIEFLDEEPEVTITYFEPDKKKDGGAYVSITGTVKRIEEYERIVI